MTHEEFQKRVQNIPGPELIEMAEKAVSKLCKTGAKSFTMSIPPRIDDTDVVLIEIIQRFKKLALTQPPIEHECVEKEIESEVFQPTVNLRFMEKEILLSNNSATKRLILQQLYKGSAGTEEWRDVEVVVEDKSKNTLWR